MILKQIIVNQKPITCTACPLREIYTRHCGKIGSINYNGGVVFGKMPDEDCKLREGEDGS